MSVHHSASAGRRPGRLGVVRGLLAGLALVAVVAGPGAVPAAGAGARAGQDVVAVAASAPTAATPVAGASATAAPVTIASVEPPTGSELGGTRLTVRGTGLSTVTRVTFAAAEGTDLRVVSDTELRVTTPAWAAGQWSIDLHGVEGGASAGFTYTSVEVQTPVRVLADLDVPPNTPRCFTVPALEGLAPTSVLALLNVTTVRPDGAGFVKVYPDLGPGSSVPVGATVNFERGQDVATMAAVNVPTPGGRLCYVGAGSRVGVLVDLVGYTTSGSRLSGDWSPERLLDTRRPGVGEVTGPVLPRQVYSVDVRSRVQVPADASAVLVTAAVTGGRTGNLRVFADGTPVPTTSVVNYAAGVDKSNTTIVALPASGRLSFWSDSDRPVDVVLDVTGWLVPPSPLHLVQPARVVDTRPGDGHTGPVAGALAARTVYSVPVAGVAPVPAGATAVVLNVTAIGPTRHGNLRVYPDSDGTGTTPPPDASWINYIPGRDIPNQVVVALPPDGRVKFWSDTVGGTVHLAADVVGYVVEP